MTADDWRKQIDAWRSLFGLEIRRPVPLPERMELLFSGLPGEFASLYAVANGFRSGWFNLLPIDSPEDLKNTWDSLSRANEPSRTRFLGADEELLGRFFIFAEIGGGGCACVERKDGSIWFEDDEGIHQTDLNLREFIGAMLREVAE